MSALAPILYQDARFIVLDKPAGLPVHPGPRGGASVEDWFPQLSRRKDGPWLVHRLDADGIGIRDTLLRKHGGTPGAPPCGASVMDQR